MVACFPDAIDQLPCKSSTDRWPSTSVCQVAAHIVQLQLKSFVFVNMKMTHQSAAAAAALCVVVLVLCSSGATARELRGGDIFKRMLVGVTGNLTVGLSPGPSTTIDLPPINVDIPPTTSAVSLPPCVAVPPVVGAALPPSVKGALPPVPACIGVPPLPNVTLPIPIHIP